MTLDALKDDADRDTELQLKGNDALTRAVAVRPRRSPEARPRYSRHGTCVAAIYYYCDGSRQERIPLDPNAGSLTTTRFLWTQLSAF